MDERIDRIVGIVLGRKRYTRLGREPHMGARSPVILSTHPPLPCTPGMCTHTVTATHSLANPASSPPEAP